MLATAGHRAATAASSSGAKREAAYRAPEACDLVDPSHLEDGRLRIASLEKEKQEEREKAAAITKAESKLEKAGSAGDYDFHY